MFFSPSQAWGESIQLHTYTYLIYTNLRNADGLPVRESRIHGNLKRNGLAYRAKISYWPIPIMTQDADGNEKAEITEWPMLLPSDLAAALLESGHSEYLGVSPNARLEYWNNLLLDYDADTRQKHYCSNPDRARCTQPIALYGDEGTVLSESTMYYNWSPELSPYRSNSWLSRFFITLMPSTCYVHHEGVNVTVQAINDVITRDCNFLATSGLPYGAEVAWKPVS